MHISSSRRYIYIAESINGSFTLGICKNRENYENYTKPFDYLSKEISEFQTFSQNNKDYRIFYSFVGDIPVLRYELGFVGNNSIYPCTCCKVERKSLHIINYDFSMFNGNFKRTYEEQQRIISDKKLLNSPKTHFGYKNKPLLSAIPYANYCFDTLHLELNISKYLLLLFESDLISMDNIGKNSTIDLTKHHHIAKYFDFLNNKCDLNLVPNMSNKNGQTRLYRTLRCTEYQKIFKNIYLPKDFPEIMDAMIIQRIWNDFQLIMSNIKRNIGTFRQMKALTRKWYIMFSLKYNAIDNHSVYFHMLVHHTHEFMQIHKNIQNLSLLGNSFF